MNTRFIRIAMLMTALLFCLNVTGRDFKEKELVLVNSSIKLPGTLLTNGDKKAPIVIFVHGSGPSDRDETIGPNHVFKQMAEGLAAKGISSYRYDKRTMLYKGGSDTLTYMGETVEDAVAAVMMLRKKGYTNIFVAGHSLGGHCMPLIAKATEGVAKGYIILSGNVRTMNVMINEQLDYIGKVQQLPKETIEAYKKQMLAALPAKYIEFDETYKPGEVVKTLGNSRWLVIQGGHDYQVTVEDFNMWKEYFGEKAEYYFNEKLDHLLRPQTLMATPADYMMAGEIHPDVIQKMSLFMLQK